MHRNASTHAPTHLQRRRSLCVCTLSQYPLLDSTSPQSVTLTRSLSVTQTMQLWRPSNNHTKVHKCTEGLDPSFLQPDTVTILIHTDSLMWLNACAFGRRPTISVIAKCCIAVPWCISLLLYTGLIISALSSCICCSWLCAPYLTPWMMNNCWEINKVIFIFKSDIKIIVLFHYGCYIFNIII